MKIKNISHNIYSLLIMFATIFFLAAGAAVAQSEEPAQTQTAKEADALQSNSCTPARTFTFSSGARRFSFCISNHGNIQKLESPATFQQINTREGYVICQNLTEGLNTVISFDAGIAEDGFGPSTITQPTGPRTLPLTIKRQTTDGKLEFAQTFDWNKEEKEILITMVLKNISVAPITNIFVVRYFDGDLDSTPGGDLYDSGRNSIWAREHDNYDSGNGLTLTGLTNTYKHFTNVESAQTWDPYGSVQPLGYQSSRGCHTEDIGGHSPGDWVGRLTYELETIQPGASKTVKVIYRRV